MPRNTMPTAGPGDDAVQVWSLRASEQSVEKLTFAGAGLDNAQIGDDCDLVRVSARNSSSENSVLLHLLSAPVGEIETWDAAAVQASGVELLVPPESQVVEVFEVAPGDTVLMHTSGACVVSIYKIKGIA